jgi:hypothetical protein
MEVVLESTEIERDMRLLGLVGRAIGGVKMSAPAGWISNVEDRA